MTIRFDDRVAIVTGAGQGLGRCHALDLARRGAKVVINDLGGSVDGSGGSSEAALSVVKEIEALGGEAIANGANVADFDQVQAMVQQAMDKWGRVDVLINNAGILRDKSFAKGSLEDFKLVLDVHLMGTVNCTKAVWDIMREQNYGRILVTSSGSGLYGNFGQSNYGSAKTGVVGLMNTLVLEGAKHNIKVNTLVPTAGTRMTEGLVPPEVFDLLTPESVTPAATFLVSEDAPNKTMLSVGAGGYSLVKIVETDGIWLPEEQQTADDIAKNWEQICDPEGETVPAQGSEQPMKFLQKAQQAIQSKGSSQEPDSAPSGAEKYSLTVQSPMGKQESELFLSQDGNTLSGKMIAANGESAIEEGKADGDALSWVVKIDKPMPVTLTFSGTRNDDGIEGEVAFGAFGKGPFKASKS